MKGKILGFLAVCYVAFALVLATGAAPLKPAKQGWVPLDKLAVRVPFLNTDEKLAPNCVVLWTARWCGSCKKMTPIMEQLEKEGFTVYVFDYDKKRRLALKNDVRTLPTIIIYQDGEEVVRHKKVVTEAEIRKTLKKNKSEYELY